MSNTQIEPRNPALVLLRGAVCCKEVRTKGPTGAPLSEPRCVVFKILVTGLLHRAVITKRVNPWKAGNNAWHARYSVHSLWGWQRWFGSESWSHQSLAVKLWANCVTFASPSFLTNKVQLYRISIRIGDNVSVFNVTIEILKGVNCYTCKQTAP